MFAFEFVCPFTCACTYLCVCAGVCVGTMSLCLCLYLCLCYCLHLCLCLCLHFLSLCLHVPVLCLSLCLCLCLYLSLCLYLYVSLYVSCAAMPTFSVSIITGSQAPWYGFHSNRCKASGLSHVYKMEFCGFNTVTWPLSLCGDKGFHFITSHIYTM